MTNHRYMIREMGAKQLLASPARRRICEYLVGCGSAYYSQIVRALGSNNGTVDYHLKVMRKGGLVRTVEMNGQTHFSVVGKLPEDLKG